VIKNRLLIIARSEPRINLMGNFKVKQANIYLYIPSLIAMFSLWPVSAVEYFNLETDVRDQVSLKDWLIGNNFFYYAYNFFSVIAPILLLILCLVFIKKYVVSVVLTTSYYVVTLITLAVWIFSGKFYDSSFSIFGKLKIWIGFYDASNVIFNVVHILQSLLILILPVLAVLIAKSVSQSKKPLDE